VECLIPSLVAAFIGYSGDDQRFKQNTITACAGLVQTACGLARSANNSVPGIKYRQLLQTKGKSKAVVAIARKLLETMGVLATRKEFYFDYDPVRYKRKMVRYNIHSAGDAGSA